MLRTRLSHGQVVHCVSTRLARLELTQFLNRLTYYLHEMPLTHEGPKQMTALSVNVNKIATLRNSRGHNTPCLIDWCHKIVCYGAQGITLHPRADQRHITPQDVAVVSKEITKVELNLEGDLREEFLELVLKFKPAQCTLVPVFPGEVTSNHGWNCKKWGFLLKPIVKKIKSEGIRV